ncbi:hypothetical protein DPMN_016909 [Dreissena polymorpha]|uniref:Uncharacterized protein n=1 Tax=Dreissena polymorpha TaxID=45954 RepID=A0A9D4NED5_DREPO|nr:hypothetical protein DPMN_016909 [Dreissena polymorpha]
MTSPPKYHTAKYQSAMLTFVFVELHTAPVHPGLLRRSTGENRDDSWIFLSRSHYFPVPPRLKPANNPAVPVNPGLATVYPGEAPA